MKKREFYQFLSENEELTKELLEQFKNDLLRAVFSPSYEISFKTCSSPQEMIDKINFEDEIQKKVEILQDIYSRFVDGFWKVDICFNLKCIIKNEGLNANP